MATHNFAYTCIIIKISLPYAFFPAIYFSPEVKFICLTVVYCHEINYYDQAYHFLCVGILKGLSSIFGNANGRCKIYSPFSIR
jgi:hypothetical protein